MSYSTPALLSLAGVPIAAVSVIRASNLFSQIVSAVLGTLSLVAYYFLRPGGPDLMKQDKENKKNAAILARGGQQLFVAVVTSLAGPDRSQWGPVMQNLDASIANYPEDIREDITEAGKIMSAVNGVVGRYEEESSFFKWYNQSKNAEMLGEAASFLESAYERLEVEDKISLRIVAAKELAKTTVDPPSL